jgi:hypothetical protein
MAAALAATTSMWPVCSRRWSLAHNRHLRILNELSLRV